MQILIWYIAIILYLKVFTETVMSVFNGVTMVIAVAWAVADMTLRQPLTCFEIKSLDICPELKLDYNVYQ